MKKNQRRVEANVRRRQDNTLEGPSLCSPCSLSVSLMLPSLWIESYLSLVGCLLLVQLCLVAETSRYRVTLTCPDLDLWAFPFDTQCLPIRLKASSLTLGLADPAVQVSWNLCTTYTTTLSPPSPGPLPPLSLCQQARCHSAGGACH